MPIPDESGWALPDAAALSEALHRGKDGFRRLVRKLYRETCAVPEPRGLVRLLQSVMRPTWVIEQRVESPEYRALVPAILPVLADAQATVLLHGPHEAAEARNPIRLAWHGNAKAPQRWLYKAGHVPGRLHWDRTGYSGWSETAALTAEEIAAVPGEVAEGYFARPVAAHIASGASKHRQDGRATVEGEGFVFVPLQLANDSVIALKSFPEPYLDGMALAVAALAASGAEVVVKRHPHCADPRVERWLASLPPGARVTAASIHAILPRARCVVTLNSGVGFEALLHLRPVVTLGRADYAPVAVALDDPAAAPDAVTRAVAGFDADAVRRFVVLALERHGLDLADEASVGRAVLRALCHNLLEIAPR